MRTVEIFLTYSGLQLRKSEQNGFHANFLISQPNPLMLASFKSSLRDDFNEWSHHRVWMKNKKVSILKTLNFRPYSVALHILLPHFICTIQSSINE